MDITKLLAESHYKKDSSQINRDSIKGDIVEDIFGKRPNKIIRRRVFNKNGGFKEEPYSFIFLVEAEIQTVFNIIDDDKYPEYSKQNFHIVKLLRKYQSYFKKYPNEYEKLKATIKHYKKYS